MTKPTDLCGRRFGYLVATSRATNTADGRARWNCVCDCGVMPVVRAADLLSGNTASCGCREGKSRHLQARDGRHSPEYRTWHSMCARCRSKRPDVRRVYSDRGITVCAGWSTFESFLDDMGPRPSPEHSIDRRDGSKGYWCGHCEECSRLGREPNCRWATNAEQHRNMRTNRLINFRGEQLPLVDLAARFGMHPATLQFRLARGMDPETAVTTPRRKGRALRAVTMVSR